MTRLSPRRGTYEEALDQFLSGYFSFCIETLDGSSTPESLILQSRAYLRLGKIDAALATLHSIKCDDLSHELAAEALAVRIFALHAARRGPEALELAADARVRCFSSGFAAIEAEIVFGGVIGAIAMSDFSKADAAISELLSIEDSQVSWNRAKAYRLSLSYWRARALETRAMIASSVGDREGEAANQRLALHEFDKADVKDQFLETALLANYANSAIDGGFTEVIEFVIERANAIEWSPALVTHEFRVFSAIAEALSNLGDQLGALRSFRRCLDCAPTVPLQIRASVERARLLSEVGEAYSSREELDHAVRLSKTVNWEAVDVLSQRQLVFLAAQVAQFNGEEGERLLRRYDSLTTSLPSYLSLSDERFRAEELYARGAVARANNQEARAILIFIDAFNSFVAAKCNSRAAVVAAELAELTNEPRYIAIARDRCANQPLSISAQKFARFDRANSVSVTRVDKPSTVASSTRHLTAVP